MAIVELCDLEARVGSLDSGQKARAKALIGDAEALVEAWSGHALSSRTSTVTLAPNGSVLSLPSPPIQSVDAVSLVDSFGTRVPLVAGAWLFDGVRNVRVDIRSAGWVINLPEMALEAIASYEVTYTHGLAEGSPILAVARVVVANMVNRTITAPSVVDGMVGETIGGYSYQLQQGRGGSGGGVSLTSGDKQTLREVGLRESVVSVETPIY